MVSNQPHHSGQVGAAKSLAVRRIYVSAGAIAILQGIEFHLRPGELCALIGPSGAGKSTLIKALLGLRNPDQGHIRLGGRPVQTSGPVGYVPQEDTLHQSLTIREALTYAARLRLPRLDERRRGRRIVSICGKLDLGERLDVRIKRLSGGQKKRVSVALELLTEPPVLILDEPTSGLDPGLEARMMELFTKVAATGRIVLVATHAMQSLTKCDGLLVIVAGRVAYFGHPGDAQDYFQVKTFAGIFDRLKTRTPAAWQQAYDSSELRAAFRNRRQPAVKSPPFSGGIEPLVARETKQESDLPQAQPAVPLSREEKLAALKERLRKSGKLQP